MLPMLMALVGPKSVSGIQVGPAGLLVRKVVVFQTPPLAPAAKTVLPEGSDGSIARPPTRPERPVLAASPGVVVPKPPPIDPGPTEVHVWLDSASVWPSGKMRKLAPALS